MIEKLRRLWRSVGFRLAFYYGFLVAITMLAALGIVYLQTVGVLHQRMARQVEITGQQLMASVSEGGIEALGEVISNALADGHNTDSEIYLLLDREGHKRVGNLDHAPAPIAWQGEMQRRVLRDGRSVEAFLVAHKLPDGGTLVVGQDLRDQEMIESLVASASAAAGIVAVLLLIGGTFVFRQELERSVGAVRLTATRIATGGKLQERVAESGEDDEFALLNREINTMLDRIESLMDGVRHVSNTIAHNLRTPLTRILVRLRNAEQADTNPAQRSEAIGAAIRDIEELTSVFEKLLRIAEAEAGARRRSFTRISLDAIATDVMELYEAVAEEQGATLLREPADVVALPGDRDLLAGAIANLLDNALKYAGPGAAIRIGTQETPGGVMLTVQDNGPGVPEEELARLGARFHRLHHADAPGHGLGLASVQAVATLHGGRLRFEDAAPGLRAVIELPRPGR
ncbi:HAMP domain-containing sensor histidine kinase [Hydrogenophaga sp. BPS33]|uniref:HAMP domain-containing sensor histidine kinase n=1 Tax=Hydrogenophaga sp. BPS33 TaxID=2651974 RepID=UPI00131F88A1|nr:HAMP domain-containing sensor histidine kinase [Hydrogenophaga sp. BPS33]QHE88218.1 HAMP domain-containing histidine kinase [Hydrogenophaga sp. BPS33]